MTTQKSFKRLVRTRMEKTGESYTAARASLLAAEAPRRARRRGSPRPTRRSASARGAAGRSGSTCSTRGARPERPHREIARWVAGELDIHPLAWNAQAITVSYERARGLRVAGERADGFAITAYEDGRRCRSSGSSTRSSTAQRARWLTNACASARRPGRSRPASTGTAATAARPRHLRAKGEASSTRRVDHARLADAEEAERMKAFWRARLDALKAGLEGAAAR